MRIQNETIEENTHSIWNETEHVLKIIRYFIQIRAVVIQTDFRN